MPLIQKENTPLKWCNYLRFNYSNVEAHVPQKPGVYALFDGDLQTGFRIFYVGQAINLRNRLKNLLSCLEPDTSLWPKISQSAAHFKCAPIPRPSDRNMVERALIMKYRPECNDMEPTADSSDANVEVYLD